MNAIFLVKTSCIDPNYCGCASGVSSHKNWHRGDLIAVQNDGFVWGTKECAPLFTLVIVIGKDRSELKKYITPWCSDFISTSGTYKKYFARSKWKYVHESGILYNKETGEIKNIPDDL